MSQIKGFKVVRSPQKSAARWLELFVSGRRKEAAAQVARESSRMRRATVKAIDDRLEELARNRG